LHNKTCKIKYSQVRDVYGNLHFSSKPEYTCTCSSRVPEEHINLPKVFELDITSLRIQEQPTKIPHTCSKCFTGFSQMERNVELPSNSVYETIAYHQT